jgi:hypothetical protein
MMQKALRHTQTSERRNLTIHFSHKDVLFEGVHEKITSFEAEPRHP